MAENQLRHRHGAVRSLDNLGAVIKAYGLSGQDVQIAFNIAKQDVKSLQRVLESERRISAQATLYEPSNAARLAAEVFSVPELLGNILYHLDLRSLLKAVRVTRDFYGTTESSLKIKRKLGFVPDHTSTPRLPLMDVAVGMRFEASVAKGEQGSLQQKDEMYVRITCFNKLRKMVKVGLRPKASSREHDGRGFVRPDVYFEIPVFNLPL